MAVSQFDLKNSLVILLNSPLPADVFPHEIAVKQGMFSWRQPTCVLTPNILTYLCTDKSADKSTSITSIAKLHNMSTTKHSYKGKLHRGHLQTDSSRRLTQRFSRHLHSSTAAHQDAHKGMFFYLVHMVYLHSIINATSLALEVTNPAAQPYTYCAIKSSDLVAYYSTNPAANLWHTHGDKRWIENKPIACSRL